MEELKFVTIRPLEEEEIRQYQDCLPDDLLNKWKKHGLCTLLNGYLKLIKPAEYSDFFNALQKQSAMIPFAITAFGDVLFWSESQYVVLAKLSENSLTIINSGFRFFWDNLSDSSYIADFFPDIALYEDAVNKLGPLAPDECFGLVPLLIAGGVKDIEHLNRVKMKEYIALLVA